MLKSIIFSPKPIFTCLRLKRYDTILSRKNIRYKKNRSSYIVDKAGSVLLRFTKIPGVFQVFSRLILNFPGVKTIPILSIADRISYKYVCYLS